MLIVEVIPDDFAFETPTKMAEEKIGPAPYPSPEELKALGYPEETRGNNSNYYQEQLHRLQRHTILLEYQSEWKRDVVKLDKSYRFNLQVVASIFLLFGFWMLFRTASRWIKESVVPSLRGVLKRGTEGQAGGLASSVVGFVTDWRKQRGLDKTQKQFKQLEHLHRSGLITTEQFDARRDEIAARVREIF